MSANTTRALQRAIDEAGNQSNLSRISGIPQQRISYWLVGGHRIPAEAALKIAAVTDVPMEYLRPDLTPQIQALRAA